MNCPKKYYYQYIEGIESKPSPALMLGVLWHKVLEYHYDGKNVHEVFKEYEDYVATGVLETEPDMLEEVYHEHIHYWRKQFAEERLVMNEKTIEAPWDSKGNTVKMIVDRVVEIGNITIMRDDKSTTGPLKYTENQVRHNQQQLLYTAIVEDQFNIHIDAVEISETRLEKLKPVPINKNGKPTTDMRKLSLVTHEAYLNKLQELGLENDSNYQHTLLELERRGHPLFRRVRVQLLDRTLISENLIDINGSLQMILNANGQFPRCRSRLCDYCVFKELCNLDYYQPADYDREIIKNKIR